MGRIKRRQRGEKGIGEEELTEVRVTTGMRMIMGESIPMEKEGGRAHTNRGKSGMKEMRDHPATTEITGQQSAHTKGPRDQQREATTEMKGQQIERTTEMRGQKTAHTAEARKLHKTMKRPGSRSFSTSPWGTGNHLKCCSRWQITHLPLIRPVSSS